MPLVQSLDLLRRRVDDPVFKAVLDDVHERVRAGTALSDAFEAHGDAVSRRLHGVAAGRRDAAATSSRCSAATSSTSKIIATVKRKTISALVYPAILIALALVLVGDHRAEGRAGVLGLLRAVRRASCRSSTRVIVARLDVRPRRSSLLLRRWRRRRSRRRLWRGCGSRGSRRGSIAGCCACRCSATIARKFATSQMARTLATLLGGGLPLVNALDIAGAVDRQPATWRASCRRSAQRVREGESFAAALTRQRRVSGRRGEDGGGGRVDRRAAGDAEHRRRLLRRGDRDQHGAVRHAGRAGAARHHGHRHRRAAAGAVHAALPADARCCGDSATSRESASLYERQTCVDRATPPPRASSTSARAEASAAERAAETAQARRLAERYRLEFVDMDTFRIDQELFRSIPADLMLRYGFVPYRRDGKTLVDRRVGSDRPADDRRAGGAAGDADQGDGRPARRPSSRSSRRARARSACSRRRPRASSCSCSRKTRTATTA